MKISKEELTAIKKICYQFLCDHSEKNNQNHVLICSNINVIFNNYCIKQTFTHKQNLLLFLIKCCNDLYPEQLSFASVTPGNFYTALKAVYNFLLFRILIRENSTQWNEFHKEIKQSNEKIFSLASSNEQNIYLELEGIVTKEVDLSSEVEKTLVALCIGAPAKKASENKKEVFALFKNAPKKQEDMKSNENSKNELKTDKTDTLNFII